MGMSMVRDKAVKSFMERIQRTQVNVSSGIGHHPKMSGWLELRKGFHTHLSEMGDLVVYRTGVLSDRASEGRVLPGRRPVGEELAVAAASSEAVSNWQKGVEVEVGDIMSRVRGDSLGLVGGEMGEVSCTATIGMWDITVEYESHDPAGPSPSDPLFLKHASTRCPGVLGCPLPSPACLLSGRFRYSVALPLSGSYGSVGLVVLSDNAPPVPLGLKPPSSTGQDTSVSCPSLFKVDSRLKQGLPLLVPRIGSAIGATQRVGIDSSDGHVVLGLTYVYRGSHE